MSVLESGWQKASIYDPATGTVVQLNVLANEMCSCVQEIITTDSADSRLFGGISHELTLGFFDDAGVSQLKAWALARTPVRAVASGDINLQWYESEPMEFYKMPKADKRTGLNIYVIKMFNRSPNPAIYQNQNLLAYLGWQDSNADNLPDGWVNSGATNLLFSGGTLRADFTTDGANISATVIFPISGVTYTFSVDYTIVSVSQMIRMRHQSYPTTEMGFVASTSVTTGVKSAARLSTAGVWSQNVIMFRQTGTATSQNTVRNPALTTNGRLTRGTTFMDF